MIPELVRRLLDDAAVFPPGSALLSDAVAAHRRHRAAGYADLVGPLVLPVGALRELHPLLAGGEPLPISVTLPGGPGDLDEALTRTAGLPVELHALEVAPVPGEDAPPRLAAVAAPTLVYVEIPRDEGGRRVVDLVAGCGLRAKLRTGGVRADLHPGEDELAGSLSALVTAGVAFKATAGLHHAIRNTDPGTGFEQHGFLNLLLATAVLLDGGDRTDARAVLALRDGPAVARRLQALTAPQVAAARAAFVSFGTCSIDDPRTELAGLGILAERNGARP
ncbi:hypothetical protein [Pseudonocardia sp. HH130630-07]|uniref:hypothetical protein n=1 Tax=Pseudonocardia sp. HH130630-07 TaxID=1690815 RepID=UPI000814E7AB|nr:hypothetical protein [Pseudonocardia sp. HH130630-07]ANY08872.1 hypothetical protein AFB00_24355 [Pseudonocardia sp. HH130630-07]